MSVFYAGPNANTIIPVRTSATDIHHHKYAMHSLAHNGSSHDLPTYPYATSSLGKSVSVAVPSSQQSQMALGDAHHLQQDLSVQPWSWCNTIWSVISLVFFVSFFGFLGLLFSIFAYVDHKAGDYVGARKKQQWGWSCAAIGMVITVLGAIAVVLVFVVFYEELEDTLNSVGYHRD